MKELGPKVQGKWLRYYEGGWSKYLETSKAFN